MTRFFNISALALCLGTAGFANANPRDSLDVPFELLSGPTTSLNLLIDEGRSFDIISPEGLNYDSATGTVVFDIQGPLTCFEFDDDYSTPGVRLSVNDANGDTILDAFRLNNPLQYRLSTNEIAMSTPDSSACFFKGNDGFGLEGVPPVPPLDDGDQIFGDRLEGRSDLLIEFIDVPEFAHVNDFVSYSIRVSNLGTRDISKVGFQEIYPRNPAFFPEGQLQSGLYQCIGSNGGQCADAAPGLKDASIRGQNISLPAGGSVQFNITRAIFAESQVGGTIELLAAAIAADMGEVPPAFDAKSAYITVLGQSHQVEFFTQPSDVVVGEAIDPPVVIRVVDEFGNPVITDNSSVITLQLRLGGQGQAIFPDKTVINGIATFDDLIIADPGQNYTLRVFSDYSVITSDEFNAFVP